MIMNRDYLYIHIVSTIFFSNHKLVIVEFGRLDGLMNYYGDKYFVARKSSEYRRFTVLQTFSHHQNNIKLNRFRNKQKIEIQTRHREYQININDRRNIKKVGPTTYRLQCITYQ